MHPDELEIDESLVRALVDRTAPEFAGRPLRPMDSSGSSNVLFRLGDDLLVRLPRQPGGSRTIAKEARWLPYLAAALPVEVPDVVTVGEPGLGYPESWSIVRWIEGDSPSAPMNATRADGLVGDLAAVVLALAELPVPPAALADAELRSYRGEPLTAADTAIRGYLAECRDLELDLDLDACVLVWDAAVALPSRRDAAASHWLHGGLLAENLLVREGRLAAVLDFGGLAVGDPSVDLVVAWELLGPSQRAAFRAATGVDETTWLRGRAWALALSVMTFPYYRRTMPERCGARLAVARAVLADWAG